MKRVQLPHQNDAIKITMEYTVNKPENRFAGLSIGLINDSQIYLSSPNDAKNINHGTGGSILHSPERGFVRRLPKYPRTH